MATLGLRHAVLWVADPRASATFYAEALGLEVKAGGDDAVFMASPSSTTDHDLGLFRAGADSGGVRSVGLYHLAWEVATLGELDATRGTLARLGALAGAADHGATRSLYGHDPDGIEFEVFWELPEHLDGGELKTAPLDLEADLARFGPDTPGRGAAPATDG